MLFSGKIPFHVAARLTRRFWVPHLLRFATIRHYSRLFAIIRTIRDYSHCSLFGTTRCSLFVTIRYSGFPDTPAPVMYSYVYSWVESRTVNNSWPKITISKIVSQTLNLQSSLRSLGLFWSTHQLIEPLGHMLDMSTNFFSPSSPLQSDNLLLTKSASFSVEQNSCLHLKLIVFFLLFFRVLISS